MARTFATRAYTAWQRVLLWLEMLEANPDRARRVLIAAWAITRAILFAGLLIARAYCDPEFYQYAGQLAAGHLPYRDFQVEYPPLAMLLLLLPALPLLPLGPLAPKPDPDFSRVITTLPAPDPLRYGAYGVSFALMILALDALTLWLVVRTARRIGGPGLTPLRAGLLYVILIFTSGALLQKFDLVAGTLCLAAILALAYNRTDLAWGAVALATLVKGFPVLLLPILIGYYLCRSRPLGLRDSLRRHRHVVVEGAVTFGVVVAGMTLLVVLLAGVQPVANTILYHADRGTEMESVYANVMMLLGWAPHLGVYTAFNSGDLSAVIQSPLDAWTAPIAMLALAAALALTYAAVWRAIRQARGASQPKLVSGRIALAGAAAVLLAFEVSFRALPAHYLLAVIPLAAVIRLPQPRLQARWVWSLLLTTIFGQGVVAVWPALLLLRPWAVLILTARNAAWIVAFVTLVLALWRWPRPAVTPDRRDSRDSDVRHDPQLTRAPASAR